MKIDTLCETLQAISGLLTNRPDIALCQYKTIDKQKVVAVKAPGIRIYSTTIVKGQGWRATKHPAWAIDTIFDSDDWEYFDTFEDDDIITTVMELIFNRQAQKALFKYQEVTVDTELKRQVDCFLGI